MILLSLTVLAVVGCRDAAESTETTTGEWLSGDLQRDSLVESGGSPGDYDEDDDEEEEFSSGYEGGWFGELWEVDPSTGFESGEFGFALLSNEEDGEQEVICEYLAEVQFIAVATGCDSCAFAFDVSIINIQNVFG